MAQQPQSRGKLVAPSYQVVVNNEEQYTIWPDGLELPVGWCEVGVSGAREICLAYIEGARTGSANSYEEES
jgi:MbtH protein